METPNLNRETALRIALASRILPGISVSQLLDILAQCIDGEINEESLGVVTVTHLKTSFASADGEEDGEDIGIGLAEMKEAVRILWGETDLASLPEAKPLDNIPPRSVRVAIASNTEEKLDGHFGSCLRFLIYQVSEDLSQLIDVRSAIEADLSDDRNAFRAKLIEDCQVAYVVSVGGPAAAKIVRAGVYPIKKVDGGEASEIIAQLQEVMRGSPPPWLAKHLGDDAEKRVRFGRSDEELAS
ncbi:dinitrogenase iron-molybdenum cofactor biosynthesis protein [Sessilibacter corallicola]|uniref:dinitrogenase iron-molybdenum cofactor biosynthesis protein n=1 Tax=Sessilibacter corallicola TaxID=2904075 RepID=UPI001E2DFEC7|nr:dinitrogenase iron-molybdenum cofactor biosynthesis protein [Sessilibacter corallicola]MCE2029662.1 dinitrogenase iron-molybdenum cofactor biosynthesis protein [Sessilibacter corallicola]